MDVESGILICPKCGNDNLWYTKWQRREKDGVKKWILWGVYKKPVILAPDFKTYYGSWKSAIETPWFLPEFYQTPEKCWESTGGSTEEEWNKLIKILGCWKCRYSSEKFVDFVKKENNQKLEEDPALP